ncbi:MAG TPA: tetratricopeptide repeat protein, partial [Terriglobales bacterium]
MLSLFLVLSIAAVRAGGAQSSGQSTASNLSPSSFEQIRTQAAAGDVAAQLALAKAFESGSGVSQSDKQAAAWYRKAADQGNAEAQNNLGVMYTAGRGVDESKQEAVKWYRRAARQKNAAAMFNLGTAYYNGDGVTVDDVAAYAWFLLAQEGGSEPATAAVERQRNEVSRFQASETFEKVGDMYQQGEELVTSYADAAKWYQRAAEKGQGSAQVKLASLLLEGRYGMENFIEARHWCAVAAKQYESAGAYCLGMIYERGLGVARDMELAVKGYTDAAQLGHLRAELRLGELYWKGDGVKADRVTA